MPRTSTLAASAFLAASAQAQWTVLEISDGNGAVQAVNGQNQAGFKGRRNDQTYKAALWSGTVGSYVDLHPAGFGVSEVRAIGDGVQGGHASFQAGIWRGTAASFVNLDPGSSNSQVTAVHGDEQVGFAVFDAAQRAALWHGTRESYVDLMPTGARLSQAFGTDGTHQYGNATFNNRTHAGRWTGTAASWVDFHPTGFTNSEILGAGEGEQVGQAFGQNGGEAGLWRGSAASWVSLDPAGSGDSQAFATHGGLQAGVAYYGGQSHAGIWNGTAASWEDLTPLLVSNLLISRATSVWVEGGTLYVGAFALDTDLQWHGYLLSKPVPEPSTLLGVAASVGALSALRRRRLSVRASKDSPV